jgi:hypothetical protein
MLYTGNRIVGSNPTLSVRGGARRRRAGRPARRLNRCAAVLDCPC